MHFCVVNALIKQYIKQYATYFYVFNLLLNAIDGILFTHNNWKFRTLWTPLWSSDAIWRHKYGSTLALVMAYCLTTQSHTYYLNQCRIKSLVLCGIYLKAISQEMRINLIPNTSSEISVLDLLPHPPMSWQHCAIRETTRHIKTNHRLT